MGFQRRLSEIDALLRTAPLESLRSVLGDSRAYLVGGTVRDLMLGLPAGGDLDVAIEGELEPVLERLAADARHHERFGTATVPLEGMAIDLARTRRERYPRPGALPEVEPATIHEDLARRDFTINAIAVALDDGTLLDPHDGSRDLERSTLRVLHPGSFADDPTRALRAARYAARFGFGLEQQTAVALRATDLGTVSSDRVDAELRRLAAEPDPVAPFVLLDRWGVLVAGEDRLELARRLARLATEPLWAAEVPRVDAVVAAVGGDPRVDEGRALARREPASPSEGVALASARDGVTLAVARVAGAEWLDRYLESWREVRLAIDGSDLLAAGVAEGPRVGRGLAAAMQARLDGEIPPGREAELEVALHAAEAG
jgi:tRNA nucleotidyltransferase (CCA-adding enzyme)